MADSGKGMHGIAVLARQHVVQSSTCGLDGAQILLVEEIDRIVQCIAEFTATLGIGRKAFHGFERNLEVVIKVEDFAIKAGQLGLLEAKDGFSKIIGQDHAQRLAGFVGAAVSRALDEEFELLSASRPLGNRDVPAVGVDGAERHAVLINEAFGGEAFAPNVGQANKGHNLAAFPFGRNLPSEAKP